MSLQSELRSASFRERAVLTLGPYAAILEILSANTPADAVVICVVPDDPHSALTLLLSRHFHRLTSLALPRVLTLTPFSDWKEQAEALHGEPQLFVLDAFGLVQSNDALEVVAHDGTTSVLRVRHHG